VNFISLRPSHYAATNTIPTSAQVASAGEGAVIVMRSPADIAFVVFDTVAKVKTPEFEIVKVPIEPPLISTA
jgi:hypothetical protein